MGNLLNIKCGDWAKYVFNSMDMRSQCCDEDDMCNCEFKTNEIPLEAGQNEGLEMNIGNDYLHCVIKEHNK